MKWIAKKITAVKEADRIEITCHFRCGTKWATEELWIDEIAGTTPGELAENFQLLVDRLKEVDKEEVQP